MDVRKQLANDLARSVAGQLNHPAICGREPFTLIKDRNGYQVQATAGCRGAIVRMNAGLRNKELLKAFEPEVLAQLVPWDMPQPPTSYIDPTHPREVTIDVLFPHEVQITKVSLDEIGEHPNSGEAFIVGRDMHGVTLTIPTHNIDHGLIAGTTGSGKSTFLQSIGYQLSLANITQENVKNIIVLVTGKISSAFSDMRGLVGQAGPIACDAEVALALGWVLSDIVEPRYTKLKEHGIATVSPAVHILFDEPQEFTERARDKTVTELLRQIMVKGREVGIHVWAATHKATLTMFGPPGNAIRSLFGTTFGLRTDVNSSRVLRNDDMCSHLYDKGDMLARVPMDGVVIDERIQAAIVPPYMLSKRTGSKPTLETWPPLKQGLLERRVGRPRSCFNDTQIAIGLWAAQSGIGRGEAFIDMLKEHGVSMGTDKQRELLRRGRSINELLESLTD